MSVIPVLLLGNIVAECELVEKASNYTIVRENYGQGRRYFPVDPVESPFAQWQFRKEDALMLLREALELSQRAWEEYTRD